jgi:hypothetical protein
MRGTFNPITFVKSAYKNSPWIVISVAGHALLFALLGVFVISRHFERAPSETPGFAVTSRPNEPPPLVLPDPEPPALQAVPPNEVAELNDHPVELYTPAPDDPEVDLHMDLGDPSSIDTLPANATGSTSIGVGPNAGFRGAGPSAFSGRGKGPSSAGQGGRRPTGATVVTESAVLEGLRWLVRHQNDDGSWGGEELREHCTEGRPCIAEGHELSPHFKEGLTGLALLCFLGQGLTHDSKVEIVDQAMGVKHRAGDVILKGLKWLRDRQREDGGFAAKPGLLYNDILATMALTEAYGLTHNRVWRAPAQRAVEFLVGAQKRNPELGRLWGWRYRAQQEIDADRDTGQISETEHYLQSRDADISVTCWAVMALKSAELSGLQVPRESYDGAMDFTEWVSKPDGLVGYVDPDGAGQRVGGAGDHFDYHVGTMSALGMLVRTFARKAPDDPFLEAAARQIVQDLPEVSKDQLSVDYYYWYYASMALNQFDGPDSPRKDSKYWGPWNAAMTDAILELQDDNEERDVCSRGGWLVDDRWSHAGGPIYNTAINTLTLEVYYRFANAFGGPRGGQQAPIEARPAGG